MELRANGGVGVVFASDLIVHSGVVPYPKGNADVRPASAASIFLNEARFQIHVVRHVMICRIRVRAYLRFRSFGGHDFRGDAAKGFVFRPLQFIWEWDNKRIPIHRET